MAIPTYNSFEEKSDNFQMLKIETIEELVKIFGKNFNKLKGIFRGINKSKYKIFTTLQREYLLENISKDFSIDEYLKNFKKNMLLNDYFESLNIKFSKIAILSLLQHYRAPTPLLDFTENLKIAIYFAIENFDFEKIVTNEKDIDNYFSIFYISNLDAELLRISKTVEDIQSIDNKYQEIYNDKNRYETEGTIHIDKLLERSLEKIYLVDLKNQYKIFSVQNNIRILSQEGLFVYNNYSKKPLEIALKEFFIESTQFIGSQLDDIDHDERITKINDEYLENLKKNKQIQKRFKKNIICSYEINNNLIPQIIKLINIDREKIYPDLERISKEIFEHSKK